MKEEIIYGSHNSMTFLPPKHWWGYLGLWMARCQNKTLEEQLYAGARVFDFRIHYGDEDWEFAHGLVNFKSDISFWKYLGNLNTLARANNETIYIRLILEKYESDEDCDCFIRFCKALERAEYSNLSFFGGNRKGDWKKLYTFKGNIPDALNNQFVSSMMPDARWYEKICPYLYAKRMNKVNKGKMKEIFNLFDFV